MRDRFKSASVAKLSLKATQNEKKWSKSRKQKLSLYCGWQRDLVDFSTSESVIQFFNTAWFIGSGPRPLMFLRDIWTVALWRTDTIQTHSRIVAQRLFVIPKLDAFEGTFAEEVDDVVPSPG